MTQAALDTSAIGECQLVIIADNVTKMTRNAVVTSHRMATYPLLPNPSTTAGPW